jgi:hypothetical protein
MQDALHASCVQGILLRFLKNAGELAKDSFLPVFPL